MLIINLDQLQLLINDVEVLFELLIHLRLLHLIFLSLLFDRLIINSVQICDLLHFFDLDLLELVIVNIYNNFYELSHIQIWNNWIDW